MDRFIALSAAGIAQGAIFALIALGFLLIYKATGVINFAQGDLVTLGAYLGVFVINDLGLPPLGAYAVVVVAMFGIGALLERVAVAPLRGRSIHVMLISTMGAGLAIRAALGQLLGSQPQRLRSPFQGKTVTLFGGVISMQRVVIIGVTAVVVTGLIWLFYRTTFGRQVRALASDREAAMLQGIRVSRVSMVSFGLSASLAGLAGLLIGPLTAVDQTLGFGPMLSAFAAAILGGFGSLAGVVLGGGIIGLVEQLVGGYLWPRWASAYPFILLLIMIAWRPNGLVKGEVGERV